MLETLQLLTPVHEAPFQESVQPCLHRQPEWHSLQRIHPFIHSLAISLVHTGSLGGQGQSFTAGIYCRDKQPHKLTFTPMGNLVSDRRSAQVCAVMSDPEIHIVLCTISEGYYPFKALILAFMSHAFYFSKFTQSDSLRPSFLSFH